MTFQIKQGPTFHIPFTPREFIGGLAFSGRKEALYIPFFDSLVTAGRKQALAVCA